MLHRPPCGGDVVDVDAGHVRAGQGTLDDHGRAGVGQLEQLGVVAPRPGDHQAVGAPRPDEVTVGRVRRPIRLDQDSIALGAGGRGQAAQRLGQEGVLRDLFGRLPQDDAEGVGPTRGEPPGGCVRLVAELRRCRRGRVLGWPG